MDITVHAILMIVLPVVALIAIAVVKRRRPTARQALIAAFFSLIAMSAVQAANVHLCKKGVPRNQWLIIGLCLMLVLLFVNKAGLRRAIATLLFFGMVGLSCHYTDVVHRSGWTGNPSFKGNAEAELRSLKSEIADNLKKYPGAAPSYPAGWLRELSLPKPLQETVNDVHPNRIVTGEVWHSWLTRLYRESHVFQDFWYPGGRLDESAEKIELRDRADDTNE